MATKSSTKQTDKQKIEGLESKLSNLESFVCKLATLTGNPNHLHEFGFTPWKPSKKDMSKH